MASTAITNEAQANVAKAMYDLHRRNKRGLLGFSAKEIDALVAALATAKDEILANDDEFTRRPAAWSDTVESAYAEGAADSLS